MQKNVIVPEQNAPATNHKGTVESKTAANTTYTRDPILELYLREISETPLLKLDEELALARKVLNGDQQAKETMVKANLRLVVKIAKDYEGLGVAISDLISEGNIGLLKAVERFDPDRGCKFSTYAALWIKQCVKRSLSCHGRTVRLPVHAVSRLSSLLEASHKLEGELGRRPDNAELAKATNLKVAQVAHLMATGAKPASLDAQVGGEDDREFAETLADDRTDTPYESLASDGLTGLALSLIDHVGDREKVILTRRFGLDGSQPQTLEELGADFGLTRERIRQLQNSALAKLRSLINAEEGQLNLANSAVN
jgi:RNA polymerase primary sigma factor